MTNNNAIPLTAFVLLILAILYILVTQQPLVIDAAPNEHQLNAAEKIFSALVTLSAFATIFIAMRRAYRAGSKFWFFSCLFVWPLSFFYTLLINREDER